jgi:hypothetical protein
MTRFHSEMESSVPHPILRVQPRPLPVGPTRQEQLDEAIRSFEDEKMKDGKTSANAVRARSSDTEGKDRPVVAARWIGCWFARSLALIWKENRHSKGLSDGKRRKASRTESQDVRQLPSGSTDDRSGIEEHEQSQQDQQVCENRSKS